MFLKRGCNHSSSIKFKLTCLYSGLFILSSCILFFSIYAYIAKTLVDHDRGLILTELRELSVQYAQKGIRSTKELIDTKNNFHRQHPFLVRITNNRNRTLGMYLPTPWTEFNTNNLEKLTIESQSKWARLEDLGGKYYLEIASVRLNDGNWMQVGMSSEGRDKILGRLQSTFYVVVGVMVVLAFISGWILAQYALRPIQHLIASVNAVATGKMDTRVPMSGNGDELDELAIQFNKMLQKIDILLKAMKDCLDNVAHDLRTPITRLRIIADRALQDFKHQTEADHHYALVSCVKETERIDQLLNILLNISEAESGVMQIQYQIVEIKSLVENIVDAYRLVAEDKNIKIGIEGDFSLKGWMDPNRMSQVLANLLDNAIKYTLDRGEVLVGISHDEHNLILYVQDNGIGISKEDSGRIWERLYRGARSRKQSGLGLGLSQAKAIVEAHGGTIQVFSEPDMGSIFTIRLPRNRVGYLIA